MDNSNTALISLPLTFLHGSGVGFDVMHQLRKCFGDVKRFLDCYDLTGACKMKLLQMMSTLNNYSR